MTITKLAETFKYLWYDDSINTMEDSDQLKAVHFQNLPEISQEPRFRVGVTSCTMPEADVLELILTKPDGFTFSPGQYVWIVLPERSKISGLIDRRAYSMCSATDEPHLQFCIRLTQSDFLQAVKSLKKGDEVEVIGPMGSSFCPAPQGAVMISDGIGISPFLSILKSSLPGEFSLLAYYSKERSSPRIQALESIIKKNPHHVVSIHEGIPTREQIATVVIPEDKRHVYISGSQEFVDHVNEHCLALGIRPERLVFEAQYPTGKMSKDLHEIFDPSGYPLFPSSASRAVKELPELGELFYMIVKQTSNHVIITDSGGIILFANQASEETTGYSFGEVYGQTPRLWGGMMPPTFYQNLWKAKLSGQSIKYEVLNRHKNGSLYVALAHITPIQRDNQTIAYVATEEDITQLRRLDKAKTEFVFLASHQLLTPLSAIGWSIESLLDDSETLSPQQRKNLVEIQNADKRMVALIHALLNVSRIDMGTFGVSPESIQPGVILQSVFDELQPSIQEKDLSLKLVCPKDLPKAQADPALVRVIFQNLLSNAVKYTPRGGQIGCEISFEKEKFHISVSDSGIGIPKLQQNKIYQKLFRADNAKRQDTQGTGLGLYIVKAIVDRSGGTIWFESEENKGTTFHVSLPQLGVEQKGTTSIEGSSPS